MKIATWNINSLAIRQPQVLDWLAAHRPDVLCLQETKLTDDKFPHEELNAAGYRAECFGQKTYNGVALLIAESAGRQVQDVTRNIPDHDDAQALPVIALTAAAGLKIATKRASPARTTR